MNSQRCVAIAVLATSALAASSHGQSYRFAVVDTGQSVCYDDQVEIADPSPGAQFYGQDAQYAGLPPTYRDNGNGTVTDVNTGLTWQQSPDTDGDGDIDAADKLTWTQLQTYPGTLNGQNFGGHSDWRVPSIKELYSLMDFRGVDPSGYDGTDTSGLVPFIDTNYFEFEYGDTTAGERIIDAQYFSSTEYVSTTMGGDATVFGVNFADGRIKGYPRDTGPGGAPFTQFVRCVRGNPDYGVNDLVDKGDGTVMDLATGLMWRQDDGGATYNWEDALNHAETMVFAGRDDWRLPDVKELQGIVDYTRSPDTTNSPAIDPVFSATAITDEAGGTNYACYWTCTTHANWTTTAGGWAAYVAFGEAMGYLGPPGIGQWLDVHGAGAQRSDSKSGDPASWPYGNGPQGDAVRVYNHVRAVRGPFCPADLDLDGDIDLGDHATLVGCLAGPGFAVVSPCDEADFDADGDVDLADCEYMLASFSGSGTAAYPRCVN